jgi:hypothetical protein
METLSITKQKHLPKGFLSTEGKPTENSILMFLIYWTFIPKDWDRNKVHLPTVEIVRAHFGITYGCENMIRWGIQHGCCKSRTSSGRHNSMSQASTLAQGLLGAGVTLSKISLR